MLKIELNIGNHHKTDHIYVTNEIAKLKNIII